MRVQNMLHCAVMREVSLTYQHSDKEAAQCMTWDFELRPGEQTKPAFNLGSFPKEGRDTWDVAAKLNITATTIATLFNKTWHFPASLRARDAGRDVIIEISEKAFTITKASGDVTDSVRIELNSNPAGPLPMPYSYMAYVSLQNRFPLPASLSLWYHGGSGIVVRQDIPALPTGAASQPWPVFFNDWKLLGDHWHVQATFDLADRFPAPVWTSRFPAPCYPADQGRVIRCVLDGFKMQYTIAKPSPGFFKIHFPPTKCSAAISTPLGHSRTAFGAIKNNFRVPLRRVTLEHSYAAHKAGYVRYDLSPGGSSPPFAVEYFTGLNSPSHYWNITVQLQDGSWYTNLQRDQKLYFDVKSANAIHLFGVSDATFSVALATGKSAFETPMTFVAMAPLNQGRDLNLPYDKNAFLLSRDSSASVSHGARHATQTHSLHTQLAGGATALQLEVQGGSDGGIVVSNRCSQPPLLAEELRYVSDYLKRNFSEVVTLFLNGDGEQERHQVQSSFEKAGLWDQVFFCDRATSGWSVASQGCWPSLQWMINNNKRLVVFSASTADGPFPSLWSHVAETVAGDDSVDPQKWTNMRNESGEPNARPLMLLNHFPASPGAGRHNDSASIQRHFNGVQRHWTRLPNFVCLEFVEQPSLPGGPHMALLALNRKIQQHLPQGRTAHNPVPPSSQPPSSQIS